MLGEWLATQYAEQAAHKELWGVVDYLARGGVIKQPNAVRSTRDWLAEQPEHTIVNYLSRRGYSAVAVSTVLKFMRGEF